MEPAKQTPPVLPTPVDYAHLATAAPARSILSMRIAYHAWAIAIAAGTTLCVAVPRFEIVLKDMNVELPLITRFTVHTSRALVNDYLWLPALLVAIGLPFALTAVLALGTPTPEEFRRREVWTCRGLRLIALLMILWLGFAVFLPYAALLESVSSPRGN